MNRNKKLGIVLAIIAILLAICSALDDKMERKELHIGRGCI